MSKGIKVGYIIGGLTLAVAALAMAVVGFAAGRPIFFMFCLPLVVSGFAMVATYRGDVRRVAVARVGEQ